MSARKRTSKRKQRRKKQRKQQRSLGVMLAGVVLMLFSINMIGGDKPVVELEPAEMIVLGEQVYTQNCAECHGVQGEGHQAVIEAPALDSTEHAFHHPDEQLAGLIKNGGTIMPAFGEALTDLEILAAIRYFQTWWLPGQLEMQQGRGG